MLKLYSLMACALCFCVFTTTSYAQSTNWNNPDSAQNISKPGVPWNITNPIGNNHDTMAHYPLNGGISDSSDYLYMYDFGLSVPANATIDGVEMILVRGACNAGSYFMDTVSLSYNGVPIGTSVTDSAGPAAETDTLGGPTDTWNALITPNMVNASGFGVIYSMRSVGICTFAVFDCKLKVHYSLPTGVKAVSTSDQVSVYPNPATTEISLMTRGIAAGTGYKVIDINGRVVATGTVSGAATSINVRSLAEGIYSFRAGGVTIKFMKK